MVASYRLAYDGLHRNGLPGLGLSLSISDTDTTLRFGAALLYAGSLPVPTIADPAYLPLVIDPGTDTAEVVWVTQYTEGATLATVLRHQEGTVASAHATTVAVIHGPTALDRGPGTTYWGWRPFPAPPGTSGTVGGQVVAGNEYDGSAVAYLRGKFWHFGGSGDGDDTTTMGAPSAWVFSYDPVSSVWTRLGNMPITAEYQCAVAVDSMHIFVCGGDGSGTGKETYLYNTIDDTWAAQTDAPNNWFDHVSCTYYDGKVLLDGDPDQYTIHTFDPVAGTWGTFTARPQPSVGGTLFVVNGELYCVIPGGPALPLHYNGTTAWETMTGSTTHGWSPGGYTASMAVTGNTNTAYFLAPEPCRTPFADDWTTLYRMTFPTATSAFVDVGPSYPEGADRYARMGSNGSDLFVFGGYSRSPNAYRTGTVSGLRLSDLPDVQSLYTANPNCPLTWTGSQFTTFPLSCKAISGTDGATAATPTHLSPFSTPFAGSIFCYHAGCTVLEVIVSYSCSVDEKVYFGLYDPATGGGTGAVAHYLAYSGALYQAPNTDVHVVTLRAVVVPLPHQFSQDFEVRACATTGTVTLHNAQPADPVDPTVGGLSQITATLLPNNPNV